MKKTTKKFVRKGPSCAKQLTKAKRKNSIHRISRTVPKVKSKNKSITKVDPLHRVSGYNTQQKQALCNKKKVVKKSKSSTPTKSKQKSTKKIGKKLQNKFNKK